MKKTLPVKAVIALSIYTLFCLCPAYSQCISSSWHNATNFTTDNSTGIYDFSTPSNSQVSDNSRASASALISLLSGNTYYLEATGFGFSIPSYASICGVTVEIECRATGLILTAAVKDNDVKIIKGGVMAGTDHSLGSDWGSSDAYRSYGGASDTWGTTLLYSDVNASNFGIAISAKIIALVAALPNAQIDHIRMMIEYNPILPLTLEYFTGTRKNDKVNLEWKTSEEESGASITVQRSVSNGNWKDMRRFDLHDYTGYKIYKYTDTVSTELDCQYRLQIIKASGQITFTDIKRFAGTASNMMTIYPNPAADHIVVNAKQASVTDMWGRQLNVPIVKNGNSSTLFVSGLAPGIYYINNGLETRQFIKQ